MDLPLRCRCGRMRGVASNVSPSTGFRFVCYCEDCQAFARFLDRTDVLDPAGGTDIFHMPPGRVKLTAGTDAMRCLRLSDKVLRWYTECCRTPIANTPLARASRSSAWFIASWTMRPTAVPATRCSVRRYAASSNALLSGRSRRTRPVRRPSGFSPAARQNCSAGGCAGSVGPRHSAMIGPRLRAPCRACSRRASAPLFDPLWRRSRRMLGVVQHLPVPRSSEYPALRRGHWTMGRPSVRQLCSPFGRCGQPVGESSHLSCRP